MPPSDRASTPPPGRTAFALGLAGGWIGGTLWVIVEGAWLAAHHHEVGPAIVVLGLGMAAPFILLGGLLLGAIAQGWAGTALGQRPEPLGEGLVQWLRHGSPDDPIGSAAAILTAAVAVGSLGGGTFVIAPRIWASIATPAWAVALLLVVQLGLLGLLAAAWPLMHRASRELFQLLARVRRVEGFVRPLPVLGVLGLALTILTISAAVQHADTVALLPWGLVIGPTLGAPLALLCVTRARRTTRAMGWLRRARQVLLVVLVGLAALALFLPERLHSWRAPLLAHPSAARVCFSMLHWLLDFDGDGAVGLLGGSDCAPFDPARGPHQLEIPRNGVDEDCSGRDLTIPEERAVLGDAHHPPPANFTRRPHVVLVTTDALSHSHTGLGGYGRPVTPELDRWAARATIFDSAFATGPETASALPALFTGVFSSMVPAMQRHPPRDSLPLDERATLAGALAAAGYRTVAIVGNSYFAPPGWPTLTKGFGRVDDEAAAQAGQRHGGFKVHSAPEVTDHAITAVRERSDQPLFLWVHYFDHHPYYWIPKGAVPFGDGTSHVDTYDTELRFADAHWGKLLAAVEEQWSPSEYLLIFTADHGEAFDDNHRVVHHKHCLRTPELHVPFVVQTPRRRGERIAGLTSHLDIVPTLFGLAGLTSPLPLQGESLIPVLFDGAEPAKTVVFGIFYDPLGKVSGGDFFKQLAVRTQDLSYLDDRDHHNAGLYQWRRDPLENHDLSRELPDMAEWTRFLVNRQLAMLRKYERGVR